ncbi:hypothetical protein Sde_3404 [Saccharophagus degradans 2-40]|uniref:Uncharacterized protein n=1 Tax=Saccharophagus degradans (strain 2-40 / ATCC 43961 / DSM 17024) TaxID=203122 RepID=Q21F70_SACD2|nr:hypothetical protein Sde_3404 [Saccharophagus degradans 2-40]
MHFICFTDLKTYKYAPKRDVNHTFLVKSVIGAKFTTYASSQRREAVSAKWLRPNFKQVLPRISHLAARIIILGSNTGAT